MATNTSTSPPDMPITIKVVYNGRDENRKFKLPLRELGASSLPDKVRLTEQNLPQLTAVALNEQLLPMYSRHIQTYPHMIKWKIC